MGHLDISDAGYVLPDGRPLLRGSTCAWATALTVAELGIMERDDTPARMRYAQALADWADVGGYEAEAGWDEVTHAVLSLDVERCQHREVRSLSGGEQKRLVLEALLRGSDEVLLLDEPDNYLDVPIKRRLETRLAASDKTAWPRTTRPPRHGCAGSRTPGRHR